VCPKPPLGQVVGKVRGAGLNWTVCELCCLLGHLPRQSVYVRSTIVCDSGDSYTGRESLESQLVCRFVENTTFQSLILHTKACIAFGFATQLCFFSFVLAQKGFMKKSKYWYFNYNFRPYLYSDL
jgi:hypothetical protein